MSKVINNTILSRINEDPEYFSKDQLVSYLNQMRGQSDHLQRTLKREEESTKFYSDYVTKYGATMRTFYSRNILSRIYLAIKKDIR